MTDNNPNWLRDEFEKAWAEAGRKLAIKVQARRIATQRTEKRRAAKAHKPVKA